MNKEEIVRPFLSKTIRCCERCGKIDIKTYATYKLDHKDNKYKLSGIYAKCPECEQIKDFTNDEIEKQLEELNIK